MKGSLPRSRAWKNISPADATPSPQWHDPARKFRSENADPNIFAEAAPPSKPPVPKARSPLPPRPPQHPGSNPLKRKLDMMAVPENGVSGSLHSGVKVVVRMRPLKDGEGEQIVHKVSPNSVSVLDNVFSFDSVADTDSTQQDVFELVGVPLVENCLAGFNSSIFAYGQTGSGKTFTMWGPTNVLIEEEFSTNDQKGLTPRVFERLFSRINEERVKHSEIELTYQCRCSFLEIYNEQITDLLDSNQKNLHIREDVKSGVYVEDLTEEYVYDVNDVIKLLIKGLTNRRIGSTSINADSSRSHTVFTCVVEFRSKNMVDNARRFKISRINLVDLAGSERQKLTRAAGERLKEAGNINRSLSQLGNLINILAEVSQSGKQRHIPYRDSKLTFLLQESLGGNAKLAMICSISPAQSCKSETFSTLRFAQRAKAIKTKATVNEVRQEDVNSMREIIRQLRDELMWLKSNGNFPAYNGCSSTGWNVRKSLSLLKKSLSHPMTMAIVDEDGDEEMEIDEEAVEKLCVQFGPEPPYPHSAQTPCTKLKNRASNLGSEETDVIMEDCQDEVSSSVKVDSPITVCSGHEGVWAAKISLNDDAPMLNYVTQADVNDEKIASPKNNELQAKSFAQDLSGQRNSSTSIFNLSTGPCHLSAELNSSIMTASPTVDHDCRKTPWTSVALSASGTRKSVCESKVHSCSRKDSDCSPTNYLEASLTRGLQLLESHSGHNVLRSKVLELGEFNDIKIETPRVQRGHDLDRSQVISSLVPTDGSPATEKLRQIPKAVEKVLAGAIRREMALEEICANQAAEITHLNRLAQQYKHERECNVINEQIRENKIHRLESLIDGVMPSEDYIKQEFLALANEHRLLKEKYEYHPEVLRMKIELKRVQDELDKYRNFFDMGEKDVLMEEIKDLRSQLEYYVDFSTKKSSDQKSVMLHLTYPSHIDSAPTDTKSDMVESAKQQLENERHEWAEMERKWISFIEQLNDELEASRCLSEKQKYELDAGKKCTDELKEALQFAMQGHARILEQYADLHEKHIALLASHRKMQDVVADVKKAAAKAGVKGAESKFIDSLASEISVLKANREKERRYWRDENKGLQQQLRDTAEAVQAAGELLVRLKDTEKAMLVAEIRASKAEKETEQTKKEIEDLNKKHDREIAKLNQYLTESHRRSEAVKPLFYNETEDKVANDGSSINDQQWREEFQSFSNEPPSPSWYSAYDQCNL